jgi:hypothetical protein
MLTDLVRGSLERCAQQLILNDSKEAGKAAMRVVKNIFEGYPPIGIDIDGTIDEVPQLFRLLSNVWPGAVVIVTLRQDRAEIEGFLRGQGIYFDEVVSVRRLEDKAGVLREFGVEIFFDDQDEAIVDVPLDVKVLKVRNGGNFDSGRWLYSSRTGERV